MENNKVEIGVIKAVRFGAGGYDNVQFGLTVELLVQGWSVNDFLGCWAGAPPANAKWTLADQTEQYGKICRRVHQLLTDAKVKDLSALVGRPVRAYFEPNGLLETWDILKEAVL